MSLVIGLSLGEVILRVRDERGVGNAIGVAMSRDVPFSPQDKHKVYVPDPVMGFHLNPERPGVNSLGIQNDEIQLEKPEGKSRIIIVGDSVSVLADWKFGEDNLFASQLQNHLDESYEVINAAVPGYTTYQERLMLEHEMLKYRPDLVIVQYTLNDNVKFLHRLDDTHWLLHTEEARRAYVPKDGDPLAWLPDWSYLAVRLRFMLNTAGADEPKHPWNQHPGFPMAWSDDGWEVFTEQLGAIKEMVESQGGRVMLMMVPFGPQYDDEFLKEDRDYVMKPQVTMAKIYDEYDVSLLDLYDDIGRAGGEALFYDTLHFTTEGHKIVANSIVGHLAETRLLAVHGG